MNQSQPFSQTDHKIAGYAKAMGHPVRVYILKFLEKQCGCFAGDISETLPMAKSTVSQHLTVLKEAGLIKGEINPPTIKYCIDKDNWREARELFNIFFEECC